MMNKQLTTLLSCLLISTTSFATGADIALSDKQAKPNGLTSLELNKLENNTLYNINCVVRSDRFSGKGHSDLRFITQGNIKVIFNRIDTSINNGNATIQFPLNSMKSDGVSNQDVILIQNLDKYDTIFVERCLATPVSPLS